MSQRKVLVTGGGGFLGRHIVNQLLEKGDQVAVYQRSSHQDLVDRGVTVHCGSLDDIDKLTEACRGVDLVFHVAAKAGVWGPVKEYYSINVTGTKNIVQACLKAGVKKLVHTSSPSVAFGIEAIENGDESLPYPDKYLTAYPETKAEAERYVLAHNSPELATCALRPHLIWGPGDNHLIPRLVEAHRAGKLMQVGDGTNLVDITYVENGAKAHIQAADKLEYGSPVAGKAYFIGDADPVNLWDWINDMLKTLNEAPISKEISYNKARKAGAVLEVIYSCLPFLGEPKMTRFVAAQLSKSHYFKRDNAIKDFGYKPDISNEEGLKRLKSWWNKR